MTTPWQSKQNTNLVKNMKVKVSNALMNNPGFFKKIYVDVCAHNRVLVTVLQDYVFAKPGGITVATSAGITYSKQQSDGLLFIENSSIKRQYNQSTHDKDIPIWQLDSLKH